jgi:hypothetical protein
MKKVLGFLLLIAMGYLFYACSCSDCEEEEQSLTVPAYIRKAGDDIIAEKVGYNFFDKYIEYNTEFSKKYQGNYDLVYNFRMPEYEFVDELIKMTLDSTAMLVTYRDVEGLPNLVEDSTLCIFNVDREKAITIAKMMGMEPGVKEWDVGFVWNNALGKYVWYVLNTLKQGTNSNGETGSGRQLLIDPYSGTPIEFTEWNIR